MQQRWFLLSITCLSGGRGGVVISRTDITSQKEAEAARGRLAAIVESSMEAITTSTLEGIVTSWNKGAEQLYGYAAAEIVGCPVHLIVPRERRRELAENLKRLADGEIIESFETIRRRKDGRRVPVSLTLSPIRDAHGKILGASGIARDMTERRRLEAEVLHATEREQQHIAQDLHDGVGQHMAGIACFAKVLHKHLLQARSSQAPTAGRVVDLLHEASSQLRELAHGLYPVQSRPDGLMRALELLAGRTTELYRIESTFRCPGVVPVRNNLVANHLYRIAQEAVINAVRHGHPKRIEITLAEADGRLTLAVRDDGTGIRLRKRTRDGIGLRIMHHRAALITADLIVQRAAGGGTEVRVQVDLPNHENHRVA